MISKIKVENQNTKSNYSYQPIHHSFESFFINYKLTTINYLILLFFYNDSESYLRITAPKNPPPITTEEK